MTKSEKLKKMIIQNWVLFSEHNEPNKEQNKLIDSYIEEDHCNEITDGLNVIEDKLGLHTNCQNCGSSTNL